MLLSSHLSTATPTHSARVTFYIEKVSFKSTVILILKTWMTDVFFKFKLIYFVYRKNVKKLASCPVSVYNNIFLNLNLNSVLYQMDTINYDR